VQMATMSGTDTGGFMGLPATGKGFCFPIALMFTFRDGLIARERRVYDYTGMLIQIGLLKAKPV
jgi:predicted ester cyclase